MFVFSFVLVQIHTAMSDREGKIKIMFANYHMHTWRCKHAEGTEREYVERAIEGGLKILGFSDHTPYLFPRGFDTHTRMEMGQMEDYVTTVLDLKREYRKDIEIHLGLEVEYYPEYFEKLVRFVEDYPVEYFLLGEHFIDPGPKMIFLGYPMPKELEMDWLTRYVDLCIEGLQTGRFLYLAHPDLPNFSGDPALYEQEMRRLCKAMIRYKIPGELNFLGIWKHRNYPCEAFWKIAGEEGVPVVLGTDAHRPDKVWDPESEKTALKFVEKYGLKLLESLDRVSAYL